MSEPTPIRRQASEPVQFAFELGQRVTIRGTGIEADVVAQIMSQKGEAYEIVFWTNQGQRVVTMVFARELKAKD
jgi:hypothetical protein